MAEHTSATASIDRLAAWLLDHDGELYGDEQERLRWYEGIALTASIQWIAVPWALAVMAWLGGRPVAPYLLIAAVVFYLPLILTNAYITRWRVRLITGGWTRKRMVISVLSGLPYAVLAVGLARAYGTFDDPATIIGGGVGAAIGLGAAAIGLRRDARRAAGAGTDDE